MQYIGLLSLGLIVQLEQLIPPPLISVDPFFGDVVDGSMVLNDLGNNALHCWTQIPEHFPFVKLGNHVIMPNHVHGIVLIDQSNDTSNDKQKIHQVEPMIDPMVDAMRNPIAPVGTRLIASPQGQQDQQGPTACGPTESSNPTNPPGGITGNKNPMLHNNLSLPVYIKDYVNLDRFAA